MVRMINGWLWPFVVMVRMINGWLWPFVVMVRMINGWLWPFVVMVRMINGWLWPFVVMVRMINGWLWPFVVMDEYSRIRAEQRVLQHHAFRRYDPLHDDTPPSFPAHPHLPPPTTPQNGTDRRQTPLAQRPAGQAELSAQYRSSRHEIRESDTPQKAGRSSSPRCGGGFSERVQEEEERSQGTGAQLSKHRLHPGCPETAGTGHSHLLHPSSQTRHNSVPGNEVHGFHST
ncbi:hypothetical protein ACOMHN_045372 [Nucella lapillus]